jgi:molybdopterin-binding protein
VHIQDFSYTYLVSAYKIGRAAQLLGVSIDTLRRWTDSGRLATTRSEGGQRLIEGSELARLARELGRSQSMPELPPQSARNRFPGIVTDVVKDDVMAKVEIQAGPHRIVSLMSREAADELGLEPGVLASASVKATTVVVERPPAD